MSTCEIVECRCPTTLTMRCERCGGRRIRCKTHNSEMCSDDKHCIASHSSSEGDGLAKLLQKAFEVPKRQLVLVSREEFQRQIDSSGHWGFFVGLGAGLGIALLVKFFTL